MLYEVITVLIAVKMKPSRLLQAVLPAMARAPKELMEDWISTLEKEKMIPCRPAGTPIFTMLTVISLCR